MSAAVRRFSRRSPCPVCGGTESDPRGKGIRCAGFLSSDGKFAHCQRVPCGALEQGDTFAHKLAGDCRCGERHGGEPAPSLSVVTSNGPPTIAETYDYRDEQGGFLFQVVRFVPKDFRQRRKDASGAWVWNLEGTRRVLYRLPELLAADPAALVVLAEGEKDVDRLGSLGYVATCNPMGARKWRGEYSESLRGRRVVVIPDADEPGRKHAREVVAALRGIAASVTTFELPGAKDATAFFDGGGTVDQLDSLLAELPDAPEDETAATGVPEGFQTPAEILVSIPQPKFRFPTAIPSLDRATRGGLPTGALVVFSGWPDAGKTGLVTQILVKIATENEVVAVLLTPDGGREAAAVRMGGLLGLDQDKLENRDEQEIARLDSLLRDRRLFIADDTREGMAFDRIRTEAEKFLPELPHVYALDSAQECLATDDADELDERHRVIALMRAAYGTVTANPIPSLVLVASQVSGSAFVPRKKDRTAPIGAPAESKKISFLSHLIVALEGDPSKAPAFGRAEVVKSKLRGPKTSWGLRVDPASSRLTEIDLASFEEQKNEAATRDRERASSAAQVKILAAIDSTPPPAGYPGLSEIRLAREVRMHKTNAAFLDALDALQAQKALEFVSGPRESRCYRRRP